MTILHTENDPEIEPNASDISSKSGSKWVLPSSLVVKGKRKRSALSHGISPTERTTLDTATHFLSQQFGKQNVYVCVEAHHADERQGRELFRKVKSDICQLQGRAGFPKWHVELLEAKNGVHSNIICCLPVSYAKRLKDYSYGPQLSVSAVYDMTGLRNYLLKESTPQAVYGTGIRRQKGSHPLGEGGGDRLRLSKALREDMISGGLLSPNLVRTYASRSLSKPLKPIPIADVEAVVAATLAPSAAEPSQLLLPLEAPTFDIRAAVEAKRIEHGLTQAEAGALIGYRQPGYSNALVRRHDPLSPWARNRALAWLSAA